MLDDADRDNKTMSLCRSWKRDLHEIMMSEGMSNHPLVLSANFKLESLILAQDERWRQA